MDFVKILLKNGFYVFVQIGVGSWQDAVVKHLPPNALADS